MIVGIDIGTRVSWGSDPEGRLVTIPAAVRRTMHGLVVGEAAAARRMGNGETTIVGPTRLMGRAGAIPRALLERLPYGVRDVDGEAICDLLYAEVRASEAYAELVAALVARLGVAAGRAVEGVALVVPASAEDRFRLQARAAVEALGIPVRRLINRPSAALLAAPLPDRARLVAVVDCAGGESEVTLAERTPEGDVRVLASAGDPTLGLDEIGWQIAARLNERLAREQGADIFSADGSGVAAHGLWRGTTDALWSLATATETTLVLDHGAGFGRDIVTRVLRAELESWLTPSLDRLEALCARVRADYRLDAVLLTGAAATLPWVGDVVQRAFVVAPGAIHREVGPPLAVRGAAMVGMGSGPTLWDVTPYPLGIACYVGEEEIFSPIVPANSPIPTPSLTTEGALTDSFSTRHPDQTEVRLDVLQFRGERVPRTRGPNRVYPHECELLGSWQFTGLSPRRGRRAAFTVAFEVDHDGILHLEAVESRTNRRLTATVGRGVA